LFPPREESSVFHTFKHVRLLGLAAATGAILLTAGCGGGKKSSSDTMTAFQDCMKKNGVTMSGAPGGGRPSGNPSARPSGNPSNRPSMSAAQQKAMQACASLRPQGGGGPGGGAPGGGRPSAQPS
jgi:hypothetical protein